MLGRDKYGDRREPRHRGQTVRTGVVSLLLGTLLLASAPALAADTIELQLKWKHAFQFAGYYMAKEKGFYNEVGLDVTIIEGNPDRLAVPHVLSGTGRYAVSDSGVLLARAAGKPVKALAAIFQHSPLALAVRKDSGIRDFSDLRGKRIMLQADEMDAVILTALRKAGLAASDYTRQSNSYNLSDLIARNTDAFSVYTTDQPHQLETLGIPYRLLHPMQYDIDFYGDILITSEQETQSHPARVRAFTQASLKGWSYALEHQDEAIQLILALYNTQQLSSEQLRFEAGKTAEMILKDVVSLGHMNPLRWDRIAKTYAELGLMPAGAPIEEFIYAPEPSLLTHLQEHKWEFIIYALLLLLLIFVAQTLLLRRMVKQRTRRLMASEALHASTAKVLEWVAGGAPLAQLLEKIVLTYEERTPGMRGSILLLKNGRLYKGAAPNLPDAYNAAIEGMEIGPMIGSCGSAAALKKRIIVSDIATDPRWAPYTGLALPHQLLACWSEPVFSSTGEVLGTFAMYYDHVRSPSESKIKEIENGAKLASIAIERGQRHAELNKLSRAIDQAGEVITITDRQGVIEYTNPAFTKITGYPTAEAIGKMPKMLRNPAFFKEVEQVVMAGKTWHGKVIETRKDGSTYPALLNISPIRDEHGEITHFVGVHENVSELESMQQKFQQAQKMEAIGTLVGGIAHDFNNMLGGIVGNLFLLKKELAGKPNGLEKLARIESLTGRAAEMIKQMLAFASKGTVQKRHLALSPFLSEAIKLHRVSIPENVQLDLNIEPELFVFADETQLQQVLLNLLTNARDAVKKSARPRISIRLEKFDADAAFLAKHESAKQPHFAHLSVSDNGHGMSRETMALIYDPFFTTKEVGKGTGLGLSMVFGAIQSHHGIIEVESVENRGTRFHIYLPLVAADENGKADSAHLDTVNGQSQTILLADDDRMLLEANAEVIQSLGYKVLTAHNGREALALFKNDPAAIDLVILDLVMPKLGGKDSADEIKRIRPDAKIIYITGYDMENSLEFELPSADKIVLEKPFSIQELSQTIQRVLLA